MASSARQKMVESCDGTDHHVKRVRELGMKRRTLEFKKLPLVEVAVRLTLADPLPFVYAFQRDLERALGARYQMVGEQPVEMPPGSTSISVMLGEKSQIYLDPRLGISLLVQANMISARWLVGPACANQPYPRFPALQRAVWNLYRIVSKLLQRQIPIAVAHVGYGNDIVHEQGEGPIKDIFSERWRLPSIAGSERVHSFEVVWPEGRRDVRVSLGRRIHAEAPLQESYMLVTAAGIQLAPTDDPRRCLAGLHDRLIRLFQDLVSEEAK